MRSDTDLVEEVANWRADHASERLRRLRRADAASEEQVCARHPDLVGAPAQDRFFELEQSGRLERIEVRALRGHLRDRHFATVRDFARRELASALGAPIDFDSNPYSPPALMARAIETANPSRRQAMGVAFESLFQRLTKALARIRESHEEASDSATWLMMPERPGLHDTARSILAATNAPFAECAERIRHRTKLELDRPIELAYALLSSGATERVSNLAALVESFSGFGLTDLLRRHTRLLTIGVGRPELIASSADRACLVTPTSAFGARPPPSLQSLFGAYWIGRAGALAMAHPNLPTLTRWPGSDSEEVGRTVGMLLAMVPLERGFASERRDSAESGRARRDSASFLLLFYQRSLAAAILAAEGEDPSNLFAQAWQIEPPRALADAAAQLLLAPGRTDLGTLSQAPALRNWIRERYNEDYWRNPRANELVRSGTERGPWLPAATWFEEIGFGHDAANLESYWSEVLD